MTQNLPCPLVRAFGGATVAFECPECNIIHAIPKDGKYFNGQSPHDFAYQCAVECCSQWKCDKHGREFKRGYSCNECRREKDEEQERVAFGGAEKILLADYTGAYLYREGFGHYGFFDTGSVSDMIAHGKCPEWAFACGESRVSEGDCDLTDHVSERILADHHEDAFDWVDSEKVDAASKIIFEACKDICSYDANHRMVVLLTA